MAVAQRTFASTQAMSGNPTTTKPGSPRARSTWTSMGRALVPSSAAQRREACTREGLASGVPEPLQSGGDGWRGCQSGTEVPERDSAPARNEDRADQRDGGDEYEPPTDIVGAVRGDSRPGYLCEAADDGGRPQLRR